MKDLWIGHGSSRVVVCSGNLQDQGLPREESLKKRPKRHKTRGLKAIALAPYGEPRWYERAMSFRCVSPKSFGNKRHIFYHNSGKAVEYRVIQDPTEDAP